MKISLVASLVFVSLLAYACGPRTRADAAIDRPIVQQQGVALASVAAAPARPTTAREKTLKSEPVKLTFDVDQHDNAVHFQLRVTNSTSKRVELTFASGQAYDFIIVDSIGREIWRWAE